jgi:CubicO group peptidase (beta-lactamase class C family)
LKPLLFSRIRRAAAFPLFLLAFHPMAAQISEAEVDDVAARTMKAFDVPGIAVGIVKDGNVLLAKGYGVNNIKTGEKTDANTLFGIASNSKAFTTVALAMLIDQGKLSWDDKVTKFIPEFRMYDDCVTREFTIRDLLTHRSGLGLGAGDLMIWPDGHDFTPQDIIGNIHFLKPVSAFRTKYDYDNLLYVIAGEVVHRASGMSWDDFVATRIMEPLGMTRTAPSWKTLKDTANAVSPHVPTDGKLKVVRRYTNSIFDSAAGIYASVNDLAKWVALHLDDGRLPDGTPLITKARHDELWTPQTLMPLRQAAPYKSLFKAYALGWQLQDFDGHLQVSHTGGLDGMVTQVLLIPDLKLGIIVLTNQQSGAAFTAISNTIKDKFMGRPFTDHVAALKSERRSKESDADKITGEVWTAVAQNLKNNVKVDGGKYIGTYEDPWFGQVVISEKNGKLHFASKRSPRLQGELFFYKGDDFVVKWNERSFGADAHVFFDYGKSGKADHFTMKPVSPLTDFSYDFQDLDFKRESQIEAKNIR